MGFENWKRSGRRVPIEEHDSHEEIIEHLSSIHDGLHVPEIIILGSEKSWIAVEVCEGGLDYYIVVAGRASGKTRDLDHALEVLWMEHASVEASLMSQGYIRV